MSILFSEAKKREQGEEEEILVQISVLQLRGSDGSQIEVQIWPLMLQFCAARFDYHLCPKQRPPLAFFSLVNNLLLFCAVFRSTCFPLNPSNLVDFFFFFEILI